MFYWIYAVLNIFLGIVTFGKLGWGALTFSKIFQTKNTFLGCAKKSKATPTSTAFKGVSKNIPAPTVSVRRFEKANLLKKNLKKS
jgi:hypothetical protein